MVEKEKIVQDSIGIRTRKRLEERITEDECRGVATTRTARRGGRQFPKRRKVRKTLFSGEKVFSY